MLAALLTAILWTISASCSGRAAKYLGGAAANRTRLAMATVLLVGLLLLTSGVAPLTMPRDATGWFLISGLVGLGIGDACLFSAYERLGTRLPALLTHCLATPLGAAVEWWWLGNALTMTDMLCIAVILGGVGFALWPSRGAEPQSRRYLAGVLFGIGSAVGMAGAAVLSRRGYHAQTGFPWLEAAVWRNVGGVCAMTVLWLGTRTLHRVRGTESRAKDWRAALPWLVGTAVLGPAIGVACYQMALQQLQAGQVQAVIALVPVLIIPMAWWVDGDRPSVRSLVGGAIGVAGVMGMALLHR